MGRGGDGAGRRITLGRREASGHAPHLVDTWKPPGLGCLSWHSALLELTTHTNSSNKITSPLLQVLSVAQSLAADLGGTEKRDTHQ